MDTLEKVLPRTIFLTVAGSHLYGTNVEGSDYDHKGVCIPTKDYFFGYLKSFEQFERQASKGAPADLTLMSLAKFVKLAQDCNPNVVELLYATEKSIVHCDVWGEALIGIRDRFLSRKARHTFSGYAHSQLKRIKTHRRWLLEPPKEKPSRKAFGLSEETKPTKAELGAFDALPDQSALGPEVLKLFLRERQYASALTEWNQYQNWRATRNPARAALEEKHGYDTKHAMHLIRLMRMCVEILSGHGVIVERPDAEQLLSIRQGWWPYEEIVEHAEQLEAEAVRLYDVSPLPKEPDRVWLDRWLCTITESYLSKYG